MRGTLKRCFIYSLSLILPLVSSPSVSGDEVAAKLLLYRVNSPGEAAYFNRILVIPAFLRLDRGGQDTGYILYDRHRRVIYSVDHEDRSILVIDPPPLAAGLAEQAATIELVSLPSEKAPPVGGVEPRRWGVKTASRLCREAYVLPGLMVNAVAAYGEYLRVLARQQALAQSAMPAEFQDACDNAMHVLAPDSLLRKGLPLDVWDETGYRESLIDFREVFEVPDTDFTLPNDYTRMPMGSGGGF